MNGRFNGEAIERLFRSGLKSPHLREAAAGQSFHRNGEHDFRSG
jgi:hypothetical protein